MIEALIAAGAAIIVGLLSLVGVIITNNKARLEMKSDIKTAQAVTDERISELTREVRMHNDFATRIPVIEEKIEFANQRISDLECFHRPMN